MKDIIRDHFSELLLALLCASCAVGGTIALLFHRTDVAQVAYGAAGGFVTAIVALTPRSTKTASPNPPEEVPAAKSAAAGQ